MIRRLLDRLYDLAAWLAALFMIGTLVMVLTAIAGRLLHFHVPGTDAYAGYCMAASGFLALAGTLRRGEHIRVTLFLQRLQGTPRRLAEIWCLALASLLTGYLAWFSVKLCWQSYEINDLSTGLIAIPLWIPQVGMAVGAVVLCIAVIEQLVVVATGGPLMEEPSGEEAAHLER